MSSSHNRTLTTTRRRVAMVAMLTLAAPVLLAPAVRAQNTVATYLFGGNLSAQQGGAPALTPTDPLGQNAFASDTVFGSTRTVYQTIGNATPVNEQAGLTLDTTSLLPAKDSYSLEMVLKFTQRDGAWRRIADVENRQSDNGYYINPSNQLAIFPVTGGATFTNNAYHDVFLTVASDNTVSAYLDGALAFTTTTTVMNINNPNNPGNLLNFYLDNIVGGGQGEYSNAGTALIRLYDGPLSAGQIAIISADPFGGGVAAPEPGSLAFLAFGAGCPLLGSVIRRRRK